MKKNVIVRQPGGPTAMINASFYGVVCKGLKQEDSVDHAHGMIHGIEGFLKNMYMDMEEGLSKGELKLVKLTPTTHLGPCRLKLPEDLTSPVYVTLFERPEALDIGYSPYTGGNDSMDTVSRLSRYIAGHESSIWFMGIPRTVNSDLIHTDHTPGYGSAAKHVASIIREIMLDSSVYQQPAVTIMELMGRNAGWLTAANILARKEGLDNPMLIYLPEADFGFKESTRGLKAAPTRSSSVIICVSERISDSSGRLIYERAGEIRVDNFGHKMLAGCGKVLESSVWSYFDVKACSVGLNASRRCSGMVAVSKDMEEAAVTDACGVQATLNGTIGMMVTPGRRPGEEYEIRYTLVDVNEVCNKEEPFLKKQIIRHGTDISEEFLSYVRPLIQEEVSRLMKDSLPLYCFRH